MGVLPNIDLDLLRAENSGVAITPSNRHATEIQRNECAASGARKRFETGNAAEFPQSVLDVEQHLRDHGYRASVIADTMKRLSEHDADPSITPTSATYMRCEVTGNPTGTDTWPEGHPCVCAACKSK